MLAPGTILRDSYTIVRLIAQGGMGAVYLAKHQRLGSTVAVKETFFDDASLLKAFEREARLLASLRHAALPKVIDHFSEGDGWFLVMEFIGGDDFAEMLKQRGSSFPVSQVMDWGDQLLGALEYLHKQTPPVIHRDIKPHNLKLTEEGQIVLLDFGLAKGQTEGMSRMTAGHSIRGYTPAYAPLEQIQAEGTDARSDLYSLAATLYHLMTGFTPVDAFRRAAVVVTGQPDPLRPANELNPQVPQRVADVLMQAMSQNLDQRPASASEMRRMLRDAVSNEQPTVVAPVAPEIAATLLIASEPRKDSDPPTITMPPPVADHLSTQEARADDITTRTELENKQPEPVTSPHPARATEPSPLPQTVRKRNRPSWMMLGIVALLIAAVVVFAVIRNRKSNTTSNTTEATDPATKPTSKTAGPATKPGSKAADSGLMAFNFDTVTINEKGEVIDRRKGQAKYYVEDNHGMAIEMVEIPGGTFTMGSPANEAGRESDEGPQHQVTVSPFYIGKYEVTQAQWRVGASLPKVNIGLQPNPSNSKGNNLPVERVSWDEAMEFCARLSKATRKTYRLPTEAEWEYACRAGTTTPFAFGDTITPKLVNYNGNYPYGSAAKGESRQKSTPVGSLGVANAFGLYDMHGNMWEWCNDWYSENYYSQSPSADPTGPSAGSFRVMRGGGWFYDARDLRSANRSRFAPDDRHYHLGFRLVRTYP